VAMLVSQLLVMRLRVLGQTLSLILLFRLMSMTEKNFSSKIGTRTKSFYSFDLDMRLGTGPLFDNFNTKFLPSVFVSLRGKSIFINIARDNLLKLL
jgi:hypothetical protein